MSYTLKKYKNSPYWYARLNYENGTRDESWRSTRKALKKDAHVVARRWDKAATTDHRVVTLDEAYGLLAKEMERKEDSDATMEVLSLKASHVCSFLTPDRDIATIQLPDTNAYFDLRRKAGRSLATIAKELGYLCAALRVCHELGLYAGSWRRLWPAALPRKFPGRKRWLSFAEYEILVVELSGTRAYVRQQPHGAGRKGGAERREQRIEHDAPLGQDWSDHFIVYVYTGMRLKDLYALRVEHVTADHVHIPGTKTELAKRTLPIATELAAVLKRRVQMAGPDGVLFPTTCGTFGNQKRAWLRALRGACRRTGLKHASTNDLRRTFASWCWQNGVDETVVVRWMGHASTKMVREVYGQPSKEQGAREIAKLPGRESGERPVMTAVEQFELN